MTGYRALDGSWIAAPPQIIAFPEDRPVSPSLAALIAEALAAGLQSRQAGAASRLCALIDPGGERMPQQPGDFELRQLLAEPEAGDLRLLEHPDLTLWQLLRAIGPSGVRGHRIRPPSVMSRHPTSRRLRALCGGDLRLLADACAVLGDAQDACMRYLLERNHDVAPMDLLLDGWPRDRLWPYLVRHLGLLDRAVGLGSAPGAEFLESRALDVIRLFPKIPVRYIPALLGRAVAAEGSIRRQARKILADIPDLDALLIDQLDRDDVEARLGAADWLSARGVSHAIPVLAEAARREKTVVARAALLAAIDKLGGDIAEFLSDEAMHLAARSLGAVTARKLEWFPFHSLPDLRLRSGAALDRSVLRSWMALAVGLRQPGGHPWCERLLDRLDADSASVLGAFALENWIALVSGRSAAGGYMSSGAGSKGLLALTTRTDGLRSVAACRHFFFYHRNRSPQCKILLECLAGHSSWLAAPFLIEVARSWQGAGVRDAAVQLVEQVAQRLGCTVEQLAARAASTCGFSRDGAVELPTGGSRCRARLDADGNVEVILSDGTAVGDLPTGGVHEGDNSLSRARASLAALRREVKAVLAAEPARLYAKMCAGVSWPIGTWWNTLRVHPVVGRLVRRLVWIGFDANGVLIEAFRPSGEVDLFSAAGQPVDPSRYAHVRLAHRLLLAPEECAAWQECLSRDAVAPPFDQFGRPVQFLSAEMCAGTDITERAGWAIEGMKLDGFARQLGYERGPVRDGRFSAYEKPFESAKLLAVIGFTGNPLAEEKCPVALTSLRFIPKLPTGYVRVQGPVLLQDVPPVLLSEAWNDLHAIAAIGSGQPMCQGRTMQEMVP